MKNKTNKTNKKNKKYIITQEAYMFEPTDSYSVNAKSLNEVLRGLFDIPKNEKVDLHWLKEGNGDGIGYITIFDVKQNKVVFG